MATSWRQPSLEFDVKVLRVAGVEARLEGSLFVRYYVPAGDGRRRIRVDTREVPCGSPGDDVFWGELVRFQLAGDGDAAVAAPGKVAFELRWRPRPSTSGLAAFLGTGRPSSRVLARAELAVAANSAPATESWLRLSPASRELGGGCKAPKLLVEVRIVHGAVAAAGHVAVKARKTGGGANECCRGGESCGSCGWVGTEEDMFLAATFTH